MRALWWIVAGACGGTSAAPPANVATPDRPAPSPPKVVEDCAGQASGFDPGHRDRFSFEDPVTHKFGFKDGKGNVVIPASYAHVYEFSPDGLAGVVDLAAGAPSPFLFIDPSGRPRARAYAFDNGPDYFQEGYARIVDDRKRVGFIDTRGAIAIAPAYTRAGAFCHGKAHVELAGAAFYIDRQGARVAAPAEPLDDW